MSKLTAAEVREMIVGITIVPENEDEFINAAKNAPNGTIGAMIGWNYAVNNIAKALEAIEAEEAAE